MRASRIAEPALSIPRRRPCAVARPRSASLERRDLGPTTRDLVGESRLAGLRGRDLALAVASESRVRPARSRSRRSRIVDAAWKSRARRIAARSASSGFAGCGTTGASARTSCPPRTRSALSAASAHPLPIEPAATRGATSRDVVSSASPSGSPRRSRPGSRSRRRHRPAPGPRPAAAAQRDLRGQRRAHGLPRASYCRADDVEAHEGDDTADQATVQKKLRMRFSNQRWVADRGLLGERAVSRFEASDERSGMSEQGWGGLAVVHGERGGGICLAGPRRGRYGAGAPGRRGGQEGAAPGSAGGQDGAAEAGASYAAR